MDLVKRPAATTETDEEEEEEEGDEEEDDEASSSNDSSTSSPMAAESAVAHGVIDGPEVKALRTARSHACVQQASSCVNGVDSSSGVHANDVVTPGGGRLRFFFAGRCVLELAHDTDDRGRPKQWTQTTATDALSSSGPKTIASTSDKRTTSGTSPPQPPISSPVSSSSPPLPPPSSSSPAEETSWVSRVPVDTVDCEGRTPRRRAESEASVVRHADSNVPGSFLPFALLRRSIRSSSYESGRRLEFDADGIRCRRAARRPFRPFMNDGSHVVRTRLETTGRVGCRENLTSSQRTQRLDRLTHRLMERRFVSTMKSSHLVNRGSFEDLDVRFPRARPTVTAAAICTGTSPRNLTGRDRETRLSAGIVAPREHGGGDDGESARRWRRQQQHQHYYPTESGEYVSSKNRTDDGQEGRSAIGTPPLPYNVPPLVPPSPPPPPPPPPPLPARKASQRRGARGRTIGEAVRNLVIREILDLGGDPRTKYVPRGVFTEVGLRHKVDATTTYRWWLKYCNGLRTALEHADICPVPIRPSLDRVGRVHRLAVDDDSRVSFPNDGSSSSSLGHPLISSETVRARVGTTSSSSTGAISAESSDGRRTPCAYTGSLVADDSTTVHNAAFTSVGASKSSQWLPIEQQHRHRRRRHHSNNNNNNYGHHVHHRRMSNESNASSAGQTSSERCHPTTLPIGVCLPYVWNVAATPSVVGKLHERTTVISFPGEKSTAYDNGGGVVDEPLDLTVPKKRIRSGDQSGRSPSPVKPIAMERLHVTM